MDHSKLVTVVITTYKRPPDTVKRALDSVLKQTYKNLDIIIVDDSPENYQLKTKVENLIKQYARKMNNIRYYKHDRNLGACAARNTGIKNAKGTYINFLDDDDEFVDTKIEKQLEVIESNSELAFVYCRCSILNEDTGILSENPVIMYKGDIFRRLLINNFVGTSSFPLIRLDYLKSEGGFDEKLPASQDYDLWLRLCKKYPVDYVDLPLVIYHYHDGEQISKNPKNKIEGLQRIFLKHEEILKEDKKLWVSSYLKLTYEYAKDKQLMAALRIWAGCFMYYPRNIKINLVYLIIIIKAAIRSYITNNNSN